MKARSICIAAVTLLLPLMSAAQVVAAPQYWGTMRFETRFHENDAIAAGGGEFRWQDISLLQDNEALGKHGVAADRFLTFCVETGEHIGSGTYHVDLNTKSIFTGKDLQAETAYLYTRFVKGTLSSYDYTTGSSARDDDAGALQAAIWYFQNDIATGNAQALAWISEAEAAVAGAWGNTIGSVRILNVWNHATERNPINAKQDMLVMIPLPAPVWMAGLGLFGVIGGSVYNRRSSRSNVI